MLRCVGPRVAMCGQVTAIGHCHIDTAWLWPFEETRRKVARAWSAQLQLLQLYPQHKFAASSAQQYAWLQVRPPARAAPCHLHATLECAARVKHTGSASHPCHVRAG